MRNVGFLIGVVLAAGRLTAQDSPHLTKAYEDVRFKVSYMHWRSGDAPDSPDRHPTPVVMVFLNNGGLRQSAISSVEQHRSGEVVYLPAGSSVTGGSLVSGDRLRALVIDLKSTASPLPLLPSFAPAFPREDATPVLNNDRVVVWDILYRPDRQLPQMRHDHHTIQVWLDPTEFDRAYPDQPPQHHVFKEGAFEMIHAGVIASERVIARPARAVAVQLK